MQFGNQEEEVQVLTRVRMAADGVAHVQIGATKAMSREGGKSGKSMVSSGRSRHDERQ